MCGRYGLFLYGSQLAERAEMDWMGEPLDRPRYNLCPTQYAPAMIVTSTGVCLEMLRWGLIPAWAREPGGAPLCNARSETVATKPSFRSAFRLRRCVVPMSGFFEWQKVAGGKTPHWIYHPSAELLEVAGIWEEWRPDGAEAVRSFAILTQPANPFMERLHDRMPLFLSAAGRQRWLTVGAPPELAPLAADATASALAAHPVSREVNSPRHDDPWLVDPLSVVV